MIRKNVTKIYGIADVQVTCAEVNDSKDTTFIISILQAENTDARLTIKHIRWKEWFSFFFSLNLDLRKRRKND